MSELTNTSSDLVLDIENLAVRFETDDGIVRAVNGLDLQIRKGRALGLVGETGAGKTTTALSILRLVPKPPGVVQCDKLELNGRDILTMQTKELEKVRGKEVSMIFQDPMTALNPVLTVGDQIAEMIALHSDCSKSESMERAKEMLKTVGIAPERAGEFPHQFSGGMKQRVVIAIALACNPALLLADEPTTALDVTIQAQVLEMIKELQEKQGTSMLLITHDLGVVAETCDKVAIMYAGEIVEYGTLEHIFNHVLHPYTKGLFDSLPSLDRDVHRLHPIDGLMPDPSNLPEGCKFHPRCPWATPECSQREPALSEIEPGHLVRCLLAEGKERAEHE